MHAANITQLQWRQYNGAPGTLPPELEPVILADACFPCSVCRVGMMWAAHNLALERRAVREGDVWAAWPVTPKHGGPR